MSTLTVSHEGGDRFAIAVRQHTLVVDQPKADGGEDTAPTPVELFVASLASCVAFYANRFLLRRSLPGEGLSVTAAYEMASRPTRVGEIDLQVQLPEGFPDDLKEPLLAVVSHCTVHNSLQHPPPVGIELSSSLRASAERLAAAG
jgi:uncharacterized OsmC-like protein